MRDLRLSGYSSIIRKYGLLEVFDRYCLRGTDISFRFKEVEPYKDPNGTVTILGPIPMELAEEIYEEVKDQKEKPICDFSFGEALANPKERAKHPKIDINRLTYEAQTTFKNPIDYIKEQMQRELEEDYDNCYVDSYYTSSHAGLDWFISKTLGYYERKKRELSNSKNQ